MNFIHAVPRHKCPLRFPAGDEIFMPPFARRLAIRHSGFHPTKKVFSSLDESGARSAYCYPNFNAVQLAY